MRLLRLMTADGKSVFRLSSRPGAVWAAAAAIRWRYVLSPHPGNEGRSPMGWLLALTCALGLCGFAGPGWADGRLYTFTDADGTVHFTDRPQDGRYRLVVLSPGGLTVRPAPPPRRSRSSDFDELIEEVANDHEVDPALVKAVVAAESNFETRAVSRAGALGLMQLMPATAAELGVRAPFEPAQNVRAGTQYLKMMLDRYDAVEIALAAYNAGPQTVDRHQGVPPYKETRAYVARVLRYYSKYRNVWEDSVALEH